MRLLIPTALLVSLALPAFAQTGDTAPVVPIVPEGTVGDPVVIPEAPGLPGVGGVADPDSPADSEAGEPRGPGGLQNGVGGEGTLAPSTTGSNDGLVNTDPTQGSGVPLGGAGQ